MTEQEAIERIRAALGDVQCQTTADDEDCDILAQAAWNEMKAIARENVTAAIMYGSYTLNADGSKTWHPNPCLEMSAVQQWAHNQGIPYPPPETRS